MAFEQRPNTGAIFRNDKKNSPNQPDMRGDVHLDRDFLTNLMRKNDEPLIKVSLSGWTKESAAGKKYLSISAQEPYEATKPTVDDEEIPF